MCSPLTNPRVSKTSPVALLLFPVTSEDNNEYWLRLLTYIESGWTRFLSWVAKPPPF